MQALLGSEHTFKHSAEFHSSFYQPRVAVQVLQYGILQAMRPSALTSGYFLIAITDILT